VAPEQHPTPVSAQPTTAPQVPVESTATPVAPSIDMSAAFSAAQQVLSSAPAAQTPATAAPVAQDAASAAPVAPTVAPVAQAEPQATTTAAPATADQPAAAPVPQAAPAAQAALAQVSQQAAPVSQQTMPDPPTPPAVHQQATANQPPEFVLSDAIATRVDVGRLARELDELDNYLLQSKIRQGGQPNTLLPKLSSMLEQLAADNQLNLLHDDGRRTLIKYLAHIKDKSPIIHVSFASDPSGMFISRLIMWFRQNIHPYALLQIGLQPQIAAGCIVRTSSKYYDFSLRKTLEKSKPLLGELLEAAR
jgi:hypothetical protein